MRSRVLFLAAMLAVACSSPPVSTPRSVPTPQPTPTLPDGIKPPWTLDQSTKCSNLLGDIEFGNSLSEYPSQWRDYAFQNVDELDRYNKGDYYHSTAIPTALWAKYIATLDTLDTVLASPGLPSQLDAQYQPLVDIENQISDVCHTVITWVTNNVPH